MSINSLNFENTLYLIICLSYGVVIISAFAEIGDYPNINPKDCGIGYVPEMADDECFQWNKLIPKFSLVDQDGSSLPNGRPAQEYDVRFVVPIIVWGKKSGSVKYDLTSYDENSIKKFERLEYVIYPGTKDFSVAIKEPRTYNATQAVEIKDKKTEFIMLKYDKEIRLANNSVMNAVCLPKLNTSHAKSERALLSGFAFNEGNNKSRANDNIHVGWVNFDGQVDKEFLMVYYYVQINGQRGCIGAIGSPLIQFVNDRAVLIGILQSELESIEKCSDRATSANIAFNRVSGYIPKIEETILNSP